MLQTAMYKKMLRILLYFCRISADRTTDRNAQQILRNYFIISEHCIAKTQRIFGQTLLRAFRPAQII